METLDDTLKRNHLGHHKVPMVTQTVGNIKDASKTRIKFLVPMRSDSA